LAAVRAVAKAITGGRSMSHAVKAGALDGARPGRSSGDAEADVLHFLTRTLQAHFLDAEPEHLLSKLRNLQTALDQQEIKLAGWPDSPSKKRICEALAKARNQVAEIVGAFGNPSSSVGRSKPM
jgi:hypothetical protein